MRCCYCPAIQSLAVCDVRTAETVRAAIDACYFGMTNAARGEPHCCGREGYLQGVIRRTKRFKHGVAPYTNTTADPWRRSAKSTDGSPIGFSARPLLRANINLSA